MVVYGLLVSTRTSCLSQKATDTHLPYVFSLVYFLIFRFFQRLAPLNKSAGCLQSI